MELEGQSAKGGGTVELEEVGAINNWGTTILHMRLLRQFCPVLRVRNPSMAFVLRKFSLLQVVRKCPVEDDLSRGTRIATIGIVVAKHRIK